MLRIPRHRAVQVTWLLCYSAPRRQAIGGQQTEHSARLFSNSESAAESVWCTLPPERRRHAVKNKDGMPAFFRCWRSVRLAKTSSFWRPRDVILDLILHPWSSFGQPFGALDAHLGPFWAPWRSRVPKLMIRSLTRSRRFCARQPWPVDPEPGLVLLAWASRIWHSSASRCHGAPMAPQGSASRLGLSKLGLKPAAKHIT